MTWNPPVELSAREETICARLTKQRRFFPFLRRVRHRLFDAGFQARLAAMYSDSPRGNPPHPPAFLAAVVLLQAYTRCSDFDAVSSAMHDTRWQMVLDCFDTEEPPFGEATLVDFRSRLVRHAMAPELLRRTVDLARETKSFGFKQAAGLRIAIDSVPLDGAGKVEDTINLLGRALRLLLQAVAAFVLLTPEEVAAQARLPVLVAPSIKAGLDLNWEAGDATHTALGVLMEHLERLTTWMGAQVGRDLSTLRIEAARAQVERIVAQDTEPDGAAGHRICEGVAPDRLILLSDPEMRHGRKSETERIDGYKQYLARDLDNDLTLAACVLPANAPEAQGADKLRPQATMDGEARALYVDRAFLASTWVGDLARTRADAVICRPFVSSNRGLFTKRDFTIDLAAQTVRCPAGQLAVIQGDRVHFAIPTCRACPQRAQCQKPDARQGRTLTISPNEPLLQHLIVQSTTAEGRQRLRERVPVEHALAHQRSRQGRFARYRGVAKNDFDAQRIAAVNNLQTIELRLRNARADLLEEAASACQRQLTRGVF